MANLGLQRGDLQRGKQFAQAPQCWLTDMALYYGDSCKMQWHFTTTAIKNSSDESQWSPWVSGTGTLRGDAGALEGPLLLPQHHDVTGREARARNALLQSRINWSASWKVRYGYTEPPCHVGFRKTSLTALCEVTWASSISVKL